MPPPRGFAGGPNNILPQHYQQYPTHSQHAAGLPPPSLGGNIGFMNPNSNQNPFAVNGNALSLAQSFHTGGTQAAFGGGSNTGLGSQAAQMGFAHGAALQQQAHGMNDHGARAGMNKTRIKEVWQSNLHEEMDVLRRLVDQYPYVSLDTQFPGIVARPMGSFRGKSDYHYQTLRTNVDLLKMIQLGITVFNEDGENPPPRPTSSDSGIDMSMAGSRQFANGSVQLPHTWQFNMKFSLSEDMISQASIEARTLNGVEFHKHATDGIDPFDFGALLISSGLVCDEDVRWISFHGGYDFGYLTKLMICKALPDDEVEFEMLMRKFFPAIYDVKYLMRNAIKQQMGPVTPHDQASNDILSKWDRKSDLEHLAELLKVKRVGNPQNAGSDALMTGRVFFQMREKIYHGEFTDDIAGKVWGLGFPESGAAGYSHTTPQHYQTLQENATPGQNGSYGTPSTPNNAHSALAGTPSGVNNSGGNAAPSTPAGGAFGSFHYAK